MRLERKRDHVHGQIVIEICLHRRNRNNVPAINEVHHSPSEIPLRQACCKCVQEHSAAASECQQFGNVTCSKNDSYAHTLYISIQLHTALIHTNGQAGTRACIRFYRHFWQSRKNDTHHMANRTQISSEFGCTHMAFAFNIT